ncbi:MAG TPA: DUF5946 family protein [Ktedonobacterales bacterium]|nr:DUF5946 family protein [Ktedonobacterales bacterium]
MPYHCPQCGATYSTDETCASRFNDCQAREFSDPAYFAVHHLSVPCFMLQHDHYSRAGWIRVWRLLVRFLDGLAPEQARRDARKAGAGGNRMPSLTRGPKLVGVAAVTWSRTIADVRRDSAEQYCADVRAWTAQVVRDAEELMRTVDGAPRGEDAEG